MSNIYDYFEKHLGITPDDETLHDLPTDSVCGVDCKRAIDACKMFLDCEEAAFGTDRTLCSLPRASLIERCQSVISVFWRG